MSESPEFFRGPEMASSSQIPSIRARVEEFPRAFSKAQRQKQRSSVLAVA